MTCVCVFVCLHICESVLRLFWTGQTCEKGLTKFLHKDYKTFAQVDQTFLKYFSF